MTVDRPTITWVNHAGFLLRSGDAGLLSDPWLVGRAFDEGWSLVSPTPPLDDVLARTTHIWFSHEHPDHFHPPSLRTIPEEVRRRTTVLYQPSRDTKVLRYCSALGFPVVELPPGRWYPLGRDLEVLLVPWDSGDSVLAMRTPTTLVLNCNDAVLRDRFAARRLLSHLGRAHVDVLMTQFSYANWEGNPDALERRRAAAASKLDALVLQARATGADWVLPFASFVWFSHAENDYLNDAVNSVGAAVGAVRERTAAKPVVLYPGDTWCVGDAVDPVPACDRYQEDLRRAVEEGERTSSEPVPLEDLTGRAERFLGRLRDDNGAAAVGLLERSGVLGEASLWLTDLEQGVRFGPTGLRADPSVQAGTADLALGSEALAFCFDQPYGGSTLNVNGRFREPPGGHPERFRRYLQLSNMNNTGATLWRSAPVVGRRALHRVQRLVAERTA